MASQRLSICIPTYNRAELLRDTLDHLASCRTLDFEIVVSDNHSPDHTPDIAKEFAARFENFRYVRQSENRGGMGNVSAALNLATGEYVYILSDDDRILEDGIAAAVEHLDHNDEVVAVFGGHQECEAGSFRVISTRTLVDTPTVYGRAQKLELVNNFSYLWNSVTRREVYQRHCLYDSESLGFWHLLSRLLDHGGVALIPEIIYQHAHTIPRMEHEMTEPWYHDSLRADYEIFAVDLEGADPVEVGKFINQRVAPALLQGVRFAIEKRQFLVSRHYLLRAKACGVASEQELANWEQQYLLSATAERVGKIVSGVPDTSSLLFEDCVLARGCRDIVATARPDLAVSTVPREDILAHAQIQGEFVLAETYGTLVERAANVDVEPGHQCALADLVASCQVTKRTINFTD